MPLGTEAFVSRLGLIRAATRSLDVQYYVIHADSTGLVLFRELKHAADRGVRVRLLMDDLHTKGEDELIAALDAHPNIEVRLYNPFRNRSARWVDLMTDYGRVNRRMHNKSITADNQVTVVGGRNIGDVYFAADSDLDFSDLDALAAGPVVADVSAEFDRYWNSAVSWQLDAVIQPPPTAAAVQAQYDRLEQSMAVERETAYADTLRNLQLVKAIEENKLQSYRGTCVVISDPPEKVTQSTDVSAHAILKLGEILEQAQREILLVSPYFVPGKKGTEWLVDLAKRGIKLRILTNSFAANDVGAVHAGYMEYRKELLEAGIDIYELKRNANKDQPKNKDESGKLGSSRASLHAKTYVMDRSKIFIGSLNLDPRSAVLNTEMGLVIDSPPLVEHLMSRFDQRLPDLAYHVELHADGKMTWTTREGGKEVVVDSEPGLGPMKRFGLFLIGILPVEEQL